jgi:two-component system NtrC family response regulator
VRTLEGYAFPGNVRELEHTIERALILAGADDVTPAHLSFAAGAGQVEPSWVPRIPPEGLSLEALEKELILQALERAAGNKSAAARLLGLTRRTLYSRMEKHGLRTPADGDDGDADAE